MVQFNGNILNIPDFVWADREVENMIDASVEKIGEKKSLFCPDCEEERTFVWGTWDGEEYFGSPPAQEFGWECTVCGSRFLFPEP